MAVYVDDWGAEFRGMVMCHMMADSTAELNAMADRIGVARRWIQHPGTRFEHYDVCLSKRRLAVAAGAVQVSPKDLARLSLAKKAATTQACSTLSAP